MLCELLKATPLILECFIQERNFSWDWPSLGPCHLHCLLQEWNFSCSGRMTDLKDGESYLVFKRLCKWHLPQTFSLRKKEHSENWIRLVLSAQWIHSEWVDCALPPSDIVKCPHGHHIQARLRVNALVWNFLGLNPTSAISQHFQIFSILMCLLSPCSVIYGKHPVVVSSCKPGLSWSFSSASYCFMYFDALFSVHKTSKRSCSRDEGTPLPLWNGLHQLWK